MAACRSTHCLDTRCARSSWAPERLQRCSLAARVAGRNPVERRRPGRPARGAGGPHNGIVMVERVGSQGRPGHNRALAGHHRGLALDNYLLVSAINIHSNEVHLPYGLWPFHSPLPIPCSSEVQAPSKDLQSAFMRNSKPPVCRPPD